MDADVLEWLLDEENPSIRYWTLTMLQSHSEDSALVSEARKQINKSKEVAKIFAAQKPEGYWVDSEDMYLPKYKATTHQLLMLAEMGAQITPRIKRAIEHIYKFQRNNGHFLTKLPRTEKGRNSTVKDGCCIDGNILYYLNHFGYLEDRRTQQLLDFIYDYYDDEKTGWKCRAYPINAQAVGPVNCYMGATKILKAFSMIPKEKRSPEMNEIIDREIVKILDNRVYKYLRDSKGDEKDKAGWKRFGYPLFYQADLLEVMVTLTRLGVHDYRMREAIEVIEKARQENGKWLLKDSFNGKMWVDIEEKNKPSKWVTLRALYVLGNWDRF